MFRSFNHFLIGLFGLFDFCFFLDVELHELFVYLES